jgi:RNA polymerase sigma-70 factor (ECF subfamily)
MACVSFGPSMDRSIANNRTSVFYPVMEEYGTVIPDEELVQRSLRGEEDAFRRLYERYRRPVYVAVCRIITDPEEARDTTQEIFIAIYKSLALWSPQRAKFLPWIYKVATNRAIDHWRVKRRRAEMQLTEVAERRLMRTSFSRSVRLPIERTLEHREQAARVRSFLRELPQPQRRFFILRYCHGLKLREIAEKEGCKLGTVKSSLHRATKTMQQKLRPPQNL